MENKNTIWAAISIVALLILSASLTNEAAAIAKCENNKNGLSVESCLKIIRGN